MKNSLKTIVLGFVLIVFIVGIFFCLNKKNDVSNTKESQELYSTVYHFAFGSRRVKIYDNGDVYDDLEVEEPNRVVNYQFVKTLSKEQLNNLIKKLDGGSSNDELNSFIIKEVYGVEQFGDMGQY